MGTKRGWWWTAVPLAVPLVGLFAGCATQQDMLEQDRKLTNMIEQQSRSVDAMQSARRSSSKQPREAGTASRNQVRAISAATMRAHISDSAMLHQRRRFA